MGEKTEKNSRAGHGSVGAMIHPRQMNYTHQSRGRQRVRVRGNETRKRPRNVPKADVFSRRARQTARRRLMPRRVSFLIVPRAAVLQRRARSLISINIRCTARVCVHVVSEQESVLEFVAQSEGQVRATNYSLACVFQKNVSYNIHARVHALIGRGFKVYIITWSSPVCINSAHGHVIYTGKERERKREKQTESWGKIELDYRFACIKG